MYRVNFPIIRSSHSCYFWVSSPVFLIICSSLKYFIRFPLTLNVRVITLPCLTFLGYFTHTSVSEDSLQFMLIERIFHPVKSKILAETLNIWCLWLENTLIWQMHYWQCGSSVRTSVLHWKAISQTAQQSWKPSLGRSWGLVWSVKYLHKLWHHVQTMMCQISFGLQVSSYIEDWHHISWCLIIIPVYIRPLITAGRT